MIFNTFLSLAILIYILFMSYCLGSIACNSNFMTLKKYNSNFIIGIIIYLILNASIYFLILFVKLGNIYQEIGLLLINIVILFYLFQKLYLKRKNFTLFFIEQAKQILLNLKTYYLIFFCTIFYVTYIFLLKTNTIGEQNFLFSKNSIFQNFFNLVDVLFQYDINQFNIYIMPIFFILFTCLIIDSILHILDFSFFTLKAKKYYGFICVILIIWLFFIFKFMDINIAWSVELLLYSLVIFWCSFRDTFQKSSKVFFASLIFLFNYYINENTLLLWFCLSLMFFIFFVFNNYNFALSDLLLFFALSFLPAIYELINFQGSISIGGIITWIVFFICLLFTMYLTIYNSLFYKFFKSFTQNKPIVFTIGLFLIIGLWSFVVSGKAPWEDILTIFSRYHFLPFKSSLNTAIYNLIVVISCGSILLINWIWFNLYKKKNKLDLNPIISCYIILDIVLFNPISINAWSRIIIFLDWNSYDNQYFTDYWNPLSIFYTTIIFLFGMIIVQKIYQWLSDNILWYKIKYWLTSNFRKEKSNERQTNIRS